jgi:hypothetical protein
MKEAAGWERPLLCDGGRGPATERHACRSAPNNIAELGPDSLMRIKFGLVSRQHALSLW